MSSVLIDSVVVGSGGVSSVVFSGIPQTYRDLHVVITAQSTASGSVRPLYTSISATANASKHAVIYNRADIFTVPSWPVNGNQVGTSYGIGYELPGSSSPYTFGFYRFDLCNYASTTHFKSGVFRQGKNNTGASSTYDNFDWETGCNMLAVTTAVTSITFTTVTGFAQHSRFCLYGIGDI
jgi:hypothetical protein